MLFITLCSLISIPRPTNQQISLLYCKENKSSLPSLSSSAMPHPILANLLSTPPSANNCFLESSDPSWISPGCSGFLQDGKDMQVGILTFRCKLTPVHKWVIQSRSSWWECMKSKWCRVGLVELDDWWSAHARGVEGPISAVSMICYKLWLVLQLCLNQYFILLYHKVHGIIFHAPINKREHYIYLHHLIYMRPIFREPWTYAATNPQCPQWFLWRTILCVRLSKAFYFLNVFRKTNLISMFLAQTGR